MLTAWLLLAVVCSTLQAFNPQTSGRDPLAVGLSTDGGVTWPQQRLVQHGDSNGVVASKGNEFSYPTIIQTPDGIVHMMFTYNRETIKYKRFNVSWISAGPTPVPPSPPTPPTPPPPPSAWKLVKDVDACGGNLAKDCKMVKVTKTLAECQVSWPYS